MTDGHTSIASDGPRRAPSAGDPGRIRDAAFLLVLAACLAFANGLSARFIVDDAILTWKPPGQPTDGLLLATVPGSALAGRPVLNLSFALNRRLLGPAPWQYRSVNVAIHAAAGLLLFGLVRRTVARVTDDGVGPAAVDVAFAAALLWLVHPLQTASVTYVAQRAESLAGLLLLLAVYAAVRRFDGGAAWWTALAVAACLLGAGVKQTIFAAPPLILLYDTTFVSGGWRAALRRHPGLYAGLAAAWAVLAVAIAAWQANDPLPELGARNPWPYALTQPEVILWYLRLALWPDPIVFYYGWPFADTAARIVPPLVAVGALLAATGWGLWRRSWPGYLGAWFFLILAPSSSFAALEQVAQCQRMYLPLAAVAVAVVVLARWGLARAAGWIGVDLTRVVGHALLIIAALGLSWATVRRNALYRDPLAFWQDNVARQPGSRPARAALGAELFQQGREADAEACFRQALTIDDSPPPIMEHFNLGVLALRRGRFDEAIEELRAAESLRPYHAGTVEQIGAALAALGRYDEAVAELERALAMRPDAGVAGSAHNNLGAIRARQGDLAGAAACYRRAAELDPTNPALLVNLAAALVRQERLDEAVETYRRGLRLAPRDANIHADLGHVLVMLGRRDEAAAALREALRIDPAHPTAGGNLLRLEAGEPDAPPAPGSDPVESTP